MKTVKVLLVLVVALASPGFSAERPAKLLNVSYDPTRELYQDFNAAFKKYWEGQTGQKVTISQSHGGSAKQARSVMDGLDADVVTLALAYDIDSIAERAKLLPNDWQKRLPNNCSPYTSTIIFLVRKGNPKQIKDWDDLIKPGIGVVTPNPKTSGSARWNYLSAWGYALRKPGGDEAKAKEFVTKLFKNVPVLDSGARGATSSFVSRGVGDVLINWENEILLGGNELGKDKFEIVVPTTSIQCEPTVSLVDKVADRKSNRKVAEAYLEYLYSEEGQDIVAKHYYRPISEAARKKYENTFPKLELFYLKDIVGDWQKAQKTHFNDGGVFDQIYKPK
jgi:sulfate/thiosulfate transport system substrate-binding protein